MIQANNINVNRKASARGMIMMLFLFIITIASIIYLTFYTENRYSGITLIGIGVFSTITFSLFNIFKYLQGDKDKIKDNDLLENIDLEHELRALLAVDKQQYKLIDDINKRLSVYESREGLSETEKERITNLAAKQISEEAINKIFTDKTTELKNDLKMVMNLDSLANHTSRTIKRIKSELDRLNRNSDVNLMLGMTITTIGIGFLFYTIIVHGDFSVKDGETIWNVILPFIPRFTLVVFIEIFAYFFLRLYKENQSEIKYFQNELTNIESKSFAFEAAYITKSDEAIKETISVLANTERNYVFKKGETTIELERAKSDSEMSKSMISGLSDFMKNVNKK
ncbi:MAG: hypothetical protein WC667_02895 [Sulfurimonas sp.]|jgi:hypothetical protein